jgi:hypothetical protein
MGERAARALRATTSRDGAVDVEAALESLHRLHRRRTAVKGAVVCGAFAVAATMIGVVQLSGAPQPPQEPAASVEFPPLGDEYDVIASSLSPARTAEAVATYRDGQPAVVLVRTPGSGSFEVAWSAPTAHERGSGALPFPAAVDWSPDGARLAILVGQEQERGDGADPVTLTLLAVNSDGTARETVAEVGTCGCSAVLPTLTWSGDEVAIAVPDGPDQGLHIEEMP